ncbi:hypothetical protein F0U62_48395 [Cystobacter fuscus]|uniref:hypothetical protein n=1 Tax=Cystobacter fuscus TaxID=43 RepID=UPI002B2E6B01|nr:hypothetical protein F0U62_48395 [Cystobacter fuscus]
MWLLACGGVPDQELGTGQMDVTEQPGQSVQAVVGDACKVESLSWKIGTSPESNACPGPQQLTFSCYEKKGDNNPLCPFKERVRIDKTCYESCKQVLVGYNNEYHYTELEQTLSGTEQICECDDWRCESQICRTEYYYTYYPPTCDSAASMHAYQLGASGHEVTNTVYGPSGAVGCYYTVHDVPTYDWVSDSSCPVRTCRADEYTYMDTYHACRHPSFGKAPVASCGSAAGPMYSEPNRSVSQLKQDSKIIQAWITLNVAQVPVEFENTLCLTCEHLSNPQDKFQCLWTQLGRLDSLGLSATARGALEGQLVHHLKLLLETSANALSVAQRDQAITLYASKPTLTSQCGTTWTEPVTASCSVPAYVKGTFAMCDKMRSEHVPAAVLPAILDTCFSTTARYVAELAQSSCSRADVDLYRQAYLDISLGILIKHLGRMSTPLGSSDAEDLARVNELHGKLAAIQSWYTPAREQVFPPSVSDDVLLIRLNELFKHFWNIVYIDAELKHTIGEGTASEQDAQAEAIRRGVLDRGLRAERQVLLATFASGSISAPPLTGDLVFYVMGDALEGIRRRLEDVSLLHDMSCRFMSCTSLRSKTRQLWGLLGSMHDEDALKKEVDAIARLLETERLDKQWVEAFKRIQAQHGIFEAAAKVALGMGSAYDKEAWFTRAPASIPATVTSFTSLLKTARARVSGYDTNALFVLSDAQRLEVGLDAQKQVNINTQVDVQISSVTARKNAYQFERKSLVEGLLGQLANQQELTNISSQTDVLYEQTVTLSKDLDGLRSSQAIDDIRHGGFMKGFELLNAGVASEGRDVIKVERPLSVSAKHATYTGQGGVSNLATVVVPSSGAPFKLVANKGNIINIQVSGEWSPTCALSQTVGFNGSKVRPVTDNQTPIMTGPEGFTVNTVEGKYYADGTQTVTSDGKYRNWTASAKVCGGFSLLKPVELITSFLGFSANAELCGGWDVGDTWNETESTTNGNGSESRSSMTLSRGVRAKRTPFPNQPAGSLLLVRTTRPAVNNPSSIPASSILSVQVVRAPNTSVLVDDTSDLYFVVNDLSDPTCGTANPSELTLKVTHLQSEAAAARNIFRAMASAEQMLRNDAEKYVAQGRLLPSQAALLRNAAYAQVYNQCVSDCPEGQSCSCSDLSSYSESLRNLFETWLAYDIVAIEREVELVNIERQMRSLHLELKALAKNYTLAQGKSRLLALEPVWALRNLDGSELRGELGKLNGIMTRLVEPIMKLRHHELQASFADEDKRKLKALLEFNPLTSDLVALSSSATAAAEMINGHLKNERERGPTKTVSEVIVSIPRVDKKVTSEFATVSNEMAAGVWRQILAGKDPVITLNPSHLYEKGGGTLVLGCTQSAPIINTMAFYLAHNESNSYLPYSLSTTFSPEMTFPTTTDLYEYSFVRPDYLAPTVQMLLGFPEDALTSLRLYWQNSGTQVATGLSPFSSIHLDLSSFRSPRYPSKPDGSLGSTNPLYLANELLIAFRVEPRQESSGATLPGVPECRN